MLINIHNFRVIFWLVNFSIHLSKNISLLTGYYVKGLFLPYVPNPYKADNNHLGVDHLLSPLLVICYPVLIGYQTITNHFSLFTYIRADNRLSENSLRKLMNSTIIQKPSNKIQWPYGMLSYCFFTFTMNASFAKMYTKNVVSAQICWEIWKPFFGFG